MFLVWCLLMQEAAWAGGIVTSCTEANLRAAMAGGGTVAFACDGTITLGSTITNFGNTILNGTGHQITISGGNAVRVFYVGTNAALTLSNLTIAAGFVTNSGGAICNDGGQVIAQSCIFSSNQVQAYGISSGMAGTGWGGAIFNTGNAVLKNCLFSNCQALGGSASYGFGGDGQGGAIFNTGTNLVDYCTFRQNLASGGLSGYGSGAGAGGAAGGSIYNSGSLAISRSSFTNNSALAGACPSGPWWDYSLPGGPGGTANGGAIFNSGSLRLECCVLSSNATAGGSGESGANGGGISPRPGGDGGAGGNGWGALFNSGQAILVNDTVACNQSSGGNGGPGGVGETGLSGNAGTGGSASGGICNASGTLWMTNCTVAFNLGLAGLSYPATSSGTAVGGITMGFCISANTILASNTPMNCAGTVVDAGCNLSSDASGAFSGLGSMTNTDPKLGPLADNGGPTWTMALLPGSPAIDAGSAAGAPATDQRGIVRPQGPGVDIGAFEYQYVPVFTGATIQNPTNCQLQMAGLLPNQTFLLLASSNLVTWFAVTNFAAGTNGQFQCVDPIPSNIHTRFYRLKSGTP